MYNYVTIVQVDAVYEDGGRPIMPPIYSIGLYTCMTVAGCMASVAHTWTKGMAIAVEDMNINICSSP